MIYDRRSKLSGYISGLLAQGRVVFTASEAQKVLGIEHGAFLDAAEKLQRRNALVRPRRGFYVAVPLQFASWGAPPPTWYIDALMRHENAPYYVGLLKAAEMHGASHQAVMEFQVVTSKRLPKIRAGRSRIVFYHRKEEYMKALAVGVEGLEADGSAVKISSSALTALDLLRYPQASGGIDNIATVLSDLGPKIDAKQLADLSVHTEKPVVQRLGYILDSLDAVPSMGANKMLEALWDRSGSLPWTELDRGETQNPDFTSEPKERNSRWRVIVRRKPEPDE